MRIAAIVIAWNSAEHLGALLASLAAQDHPDLEVVVLDNASEDASVEVVRAVAARAAASGAAARAGVGGAALHAAASGAAAHPVRLIRSARNRGFCGGVNAALGFLDDRVEAVLLVNPDVVAAPDLVSRCAARLVQDPRCGSVQPRVRRAVPDAEGRPLIDTTGHELTTARLYRNRGEGSVDHDAIAPGEVFGASGACVLHRRAMLEDIRWADGQVLSEDLFAYFDDVEVDWRARRRGWSAWYEPAALATHERGGAGPRRTPAVEALNHANRLLVTLTCDRPALRSWPLLLVTTKLKSLELLITVPSAFPRALWRLVGGTPRALERRRELDARALVSAGDVAQRWAVPFRWGPWVRTWWLRVRGRAPGVVGGGRTGRRS